MEIVSSLVDGHNVTETLERFGVTAPSSTTLKFASRARVNRLSWCRLRNGWSSVDKVSGDFDDIPPSWGDIIQRLRKGVAGRWGQKTIRGQEVLVNTRVARTGVSREGRCNSRSGLETLHRAYESPHPDLIREERVDVGCEI